MNRAAAAKRVALFLPHRYLQRAVSQCSGSNHLYLHSRMPVAASRYDHTITPASDHPLSLSCSEGTR